MAFAYTITRDTVMGNMRIKWGTFTNTADEEGGDIKTGFTRTHWLIPFHSGSAAVASAPVADETFPLSGGDVTIVTTANADGYWVACGDD